MIHYSTQFQQFRQQLEDTLYECEKHVIFRNHQVALINIDQSLVQENLKSHEMGAHVFLTVKILFASI